MVCFGGGDKGPQPTTAPYTTETSHLAVQHTVEPVDKSAKTPAPKPVTMAPAPTSGPYVNSMGQADVGSGLNI